MPDTDDYRYELRGGELVRKDPHAHRRFSLQNDIRDRIAALVGDLGVVATRYGFRTNSEYEYRIVDIAIISRARWDAIDPDGYPMGAPEIAIDLESEDAQQLCLKNGCREFWVVDPRRQTVRVSTPDGHSRTYQTGQTIPLMFGGQLEVAAIFQ
jgi:Uma2 family endonuclease